MRERVIREMAEIYRGNTIFGEDLMEIPVQAAAAAKLLQNILKQLFTVTLSTELRDGMPTFRAISCNYSEEPVPLVQMTPAARRRSSSGTARPSSP